MATQRNLVSKTKQNNNKKHISTWSINFTGIGDKLVNGVFPVAVVGFLV